MLNNPIYDAMMYETAKREVENGNYEYMNMLGTCYENGLGVNRDLKEALRCFREGAEKGMPDCINSLGYCYDLGIGVPVDKTAAFGYFKTASEAGYAHATNNLAMCYEYGFGVKQNLDMAMQVYEIAIKQGDWNAASNLERLIAYRNSIRMIFAPTSQRAEVIRGLELLDYIASTGEYNAISALGTLFAEGRIIQPDYERSVHLFETAASAGHAEAKFNLALCRIRGLGTAKDEVRGLETIKELADAGYEPAVRYMESGDRRKVS